MILIEFREKNDLEN